MRKGSPWPSALFETPVTNFWNSSAEFGQRCPAPSPEILRFGDKNVLVVGVETLPLGRISSVVGLRHIASGSAVDGLTYLPTLKVPFVTRLSGVSSLPDQRPFKLRGGAQNVQQESRGRILKISIQPLGDGDKPNAVLLLCLDVVQAVNERATKPVQLPYRKQSNFLASVRYQPIQRGAARFCATAHILVEQSATASVQHTRGVHGLVVHGVGRWSTP